MLASIMGPDLLVVLAVVLLIFGGTQIPKLARSLGTAQREFQRGLEHDDHGPKSESPTVAASPPPALRPGGHEGAEGIPSVEEGTPVEAPRS